VQLAPAAAVSPPRLPHAGILCLLFCCTLPTVLSLPMQTEADHDANTQFLHAKRVVCLSLRASLAHARSKCTHAMAAHMQQMHVHPSSDAACKTVTVHADDEPHSPRVWGPAVWGPITVARHSYDSRGQPSPRRPEGEHGGLQGADICCHNTRP
jgi:hypothetical protein